MQKHLCQVNSFHKNSLIEDKERKNTVYQPAFPCCELEDAISWALPVAASQIQRVLQESLGPDVVEKKRTLAGPHCHNVLIETH